MENHDMQKKKNRYCGHKLRNNSHNLLICGHILLISALSLVNIYINLGHMTTNKFPCFNIIILWWLFNYI